MKKFLLVLLMVMVVLTGCGKKTTKPVAVTTVDVVITNNGKKLDVTLTSDVNDDFIEAIVNTNTTDFEIKDEFFKDMDILDSLETLITIGINHNLVSDSSNISIDVKTREDKDYLYRYLYKNALEPMNEKNINVEIDFKFNE